MGLPYLSALPFQPPHSLVIALGSHCVHLIEVLVLPHLKTQGKHNNKQVINESTIQKLAMHFQLVKPKYPRLTTYNRKP